MSPSSHDLSAGGFCVLLCVGVCFRRLRRHRRVCRMKCRILCTIRSEYCASHLSSTSSRVVGAKTNWKWLYIYVCLCLCVCGVWSACSRRGRLLAKLATVAGLKAACGGWTECEGGNYRSGCDDDNAAAASRVASGKNPCSRTANNARSDERKCMQKIPRNSRKW